MTHVRSSLAMLSLVLLLCGGVGCSSGSGGGGTGGPKMRMASLQNKAGKFIEPTIASGQKALAAVKLPEDLIVWASDPEGDESYPIVTYTWIAAYKKYADAKTIRSSGRLTAAKAFCADTMPGSMNFPALFCKDAICNFGPPPEPPLPPGEQPIPPHTKRTPGTKQKHARTFVISYSLAAGFSINAAPRLMLSRPYAVDQSLLQHSLNANVVLALPIFC